MTGVGVSVSQDFVVFLAGLQGGTVSYQVGRGLEGKVVSFNYREVSGDLYLAVVTSLGQGRLGTVRRQVSGQVTTVEAPDLPGPGVGLTSTSSWPAPLATAFWSVAPDRSQVWSRLRNSSFIHFFKVYVVLGS